MKNYRIIKGVKIHVNQLASMSRKFTVSNITKTISSVVEHKRYGAKIDKSMVITNPLTGNKFMQTNPHTVTGMYGASITAYDWVPLEEFKKNSGKLWEIPEGGFKQPKRLIKCKNRKYSKPQQVTDENGFIHVSKVRNKPTRKSEHESTGHNDFTKFFPNYPYTIKPMCKEAYMEKLVAHKLEKWDKKNPKPNQDLFDKVEDWEQRRFNAEQRFRDFVVSCYNKLDIMGNRVNSKDKKMDAIKIAEVNDVNGKGHDVSFPKLSSEDKLYKNAEKAAEVAMKKDSTILDADLLNHKRTQKRPLIGAKNAKQQTLASKKAMKKAA